MPIQPTNNNHTKQEEGRFNHSLSPPEDSHPPESSSSADGYPIYSNNENENFLPSNEDHQIQISEAPKTKPKSICDNACVRCFCIACIACGVVCTAFTLLIFLLLVLPRPSSPTYDCGYYPKITIPTVRYTILQLPKFKRILLQGPVSFELSDTPEQEMSLEMERYDEAAFHSIRYGVIGSDLFVNVTYNQPSPLPTIGTCINAKVKVYFPYYQRFWRDITEISVDATTPPALPGGIVPNSNVRFAGLNAYTTTSMKLDKLTVNATGNINLVDVVARTMSLQSTTGTIDCIYCHAVNFTASTISKANIYQLGKLSNSDDTSAALQLNVVANFLYIVNPVVPTRMKLVAHSHLSLEHTDRNKANKLHGQLNFYRPEGGYSSWADVKVFGALYQVDESSLTAVKALVKPFGNTTVVPESVVDATMGYAGDVEVNLNYL